jgi:cytochrome c-L
LTACSGCHGHEAEGKLGPGLADDYWTYPAAATDQGLFEVLFGGANGMMGPQYVNFWGRTGHVAPSAGFQAG